MPTTRGTARENIKYVSLKKKVRSRKIQNTSNAIENDLGVKAPEIANNNKRKRNRSETILHASPAYNQNNEK